jgi:hypothetical protein
MGRRMHITGFCVHGLPVFIAPMVPQLEPLHTLHH